MQRIRYIFATLAVMLVALVSQAADPPVTVTAKADSTALLMGDRVRVTVEVLKNSHQGALIDMPEREKDYYGMEMVECSVDSADLGNSREQLVYNMVFQAFDPAELVTLPPFRYVIGQDTIASDILTFRVFPVDIPAELGDVNDIESLRVNDAEPPVAIPSRWYDYVPNWTLWVLLGLALLAMGVVLFMLYKKNGPAIFTPRKPVPPYEMAMQRLTELKSRRLLEQGQVKQYYTDLIDILRVYLEGRFGINAMEMTSKQILARIRAHKETHLSASQMEQVLQLADFVKFAAANPNPEDGQRTFASVASFVESTKPAPTPEELEAEAKKSKKAK